MKKIMPWIVNHPVYSVLMLLLAIVLLMGKVTSLEFNSDMEQFLPEGEPDTEYYETFFKETFGSDVLSIVVVKPKSGDVFTTETLALIEELTEAFGALDGVTQVKSLTTEHIIKGEDDFVNTNKLIMEIPDDPESLALIRENALGNDSFLGYIVSKDGTTAAINIYTDKPKGDQEFDDRFVGSVNEIIDKHKDRWTIYFVGAPLASSTMLASIKKDQMTVNPAMLGVIVVFLLLAYRSFIAVLLPLLTSGLSVAAAFGFLSLMNYPITPYIALVPGLILVVGSTEDMHILSMYFHKLRQGLSKNEAIMAAAMESALPITLTSFTTIIGFGSLALNETTIVRQFGIGMAFGLLANYVATLIIIPAALRFFKIPKIISKDISGGQARKHLLGSVLDWIVKANQDHRATIALITGVILIASLVGMFKVEVDNDYMSFLREETTFKQDLKRLNQDLSGMNVFNIIVETEGDEDALEPDVLRKIADLQKYMDGLGFFDKTVSIADHVKMMNREWNEGREEMDVVPDSKPAIMQYLLLLDYDTVADYLDSGRKNARVLVIHNISSSSELARALSGVKKYIEKNLKNYVKEGQVKDLSIKFTSMDYLIKNSADTIVQGQVKSLALALVIILVLMTIVFMSIKGGLIAIVANMIPIVVNFGIMGWFGISLNTSTCMVALIALGIAIDDTIHFMVRYQKELRLTNDQRQAMANAIKTEGEPVMFTSLALALGFVTVMLSDFAPSGQFGLLSALVMIYALLTDIFVNPVILISVQLITIWDYVTLRFKKTVVEKSLIFKDLKVSEAKKVVLMGSLRQLSAQEKIFSQGDPGEDMYLILSGSVKVVISTESGKEKEIKTMTPGDIFGEMAFLGEGLRTATVIAETETELLRIDYKALERARHRNPRISAKLYKNIARILSERVQVQNIAQS